MYRCIHSYMCTSPQDMDRAFPAVCGAYRERLAAETRAKEEMKEQARALAKTQREEKRGAYNVHYMIVYVHVCVPHVEEYSVPHDACACNDLEVRIATSCTYVHVFALYSQLSY